MKQKTKHTTETKESAREGNLLIVDDEKSIRNSLREILEFEGFEVLEASNGEETFEVLEQQPVDLLLLDIKMEGMDGVEVLKKMKSDGYLCPVIMLTGHGNVEVAVEATQLGAFDFMQKPPDLNRLLISIRNAIEQYHLEIENKNIRKRIPKVADIIGSSKPVENIKSTIQKVAPTDSRVLVTGENGTGKELVARWIHEYSRRNSYPFVEVNCAAIPGELLESELFGHVEGAFTGATSTRVGKFEEANGGTLFLDEIGDMSLDAQGKVLRALQENSIIRIGDNKPRKVDVRVVSATNKDLENEIEEGNFREDLYHRLNVIPIQVPPLRERREDIPELAKSYLQALSDKDIAFSGKTFSKEALKKLRTLPWTGNVRELQNVIERLAILTNDSEIGVDDVEKLVSRRNQPGKLEELADEMDDFQDFKEAAERLFLIHQLEKHNWNISHTADSIGIQRSHLYNKMKKYQIER